MKRITSLFVALFALVALCGLTGCKGAPKPQEISRVLADPDAFRDKDVIVAGRVTRVIDPTQGLLALAAYQVEDKTGRIWVVSRTGTPSVGTEVGLKGRIRDDFRIGSELLGTVLNEVERRTR
jgi:hypothetical protein